jgi:antitoxin PrlF
MQSPSEDQVLDKFLTFLAQDIANNPQRFQVVDAALIQRAQNWLGDVRVDLNQHLSDE